MRLTLRTLLAYLDNTLESQDAEALRQKLEQSAFATQLVQRIQAALADPDLSAPAPDSVHPIEEPNMMSNYLDSTLSPEQMAEIEKACLESAPHLAEAAACHQILTLVLGKPANASDELRDRILAMVDDDGNPVESETGPLARRLGLAPHAAIAGEIGPRYSDIDLGEEPAGLAEPSGEAPEAQPEEVQPDEAQPDEAQGVGEAPPENVSPVGADDSGVFQAATRLREQSHEFAGTGTALDDATALAGSRPLRQLERSDFYEGDVRTSRITPWLVSLALVAVLLVAISQIFAPLLGPQTAQSDGDQENVAAQFPPVTESGESSAAAAPQDSASADQPAEEASEEPAAEASDQPPRGQRADERGDADEPDAAAAGAMAETEPAVEQGGSELTDAESGQSTPSATTPSGQPPAAEQMPGEAIAQDGAETPADAGEPTSSPAAASEPEQPVAASPEAEMGAGGENGTGEAVEPKADAVVADEASKAAKAAGKETGEDAEPLATLVSEDAFVARRSEQGDWQLMPAEAAVGSDTRVVCAPEYRAEFQVADQEQPALTLVGPTEVRWINGPNAFDLEVAFGRGLVRFTQPEQRFTLSAGDMTLQVAAESGAAVVAFDVTHRRPLGADPMVPENHAAFVELNAVQGDWLVEGSEREVALAAGSQLTVNVTRQGMPLPPPAAADPLPAWIDPEVDTGSLEAEAAETLLRLVRDDDSGSLPVALRVALNFRRNEVAALAGRTMLALGDASAYFGVDGIFRMPQQRLYWSDHLDAVRALVDRDVEEATSVRRAIAGQNEAMDNADGDTLFRLLVGYSQQQLESGGDEELVADLESASMPVRVLASENLRDISGTTLYFRPEEDVPSRRAEVIKKWKVRLRKEAIRYPEVQ